MKKKGFTLIELLAVIVILAVIALIAVPAVLNIIEDSKKSAAEASARNIVSAAKTYYMQKIMEGETVKNIDLSGSALTYEGDKASKGYLSYDTNGNAYGKMYVNDYCIEIKSDGSIVSTKTNESECILRSAEKDAPLLSAVITNTSTSNYKIDVNTSDTSGIKEIRYFVNGILVYRGNEKTYLGTSNKASNIYKIESEDVFGNVAVIKGLFQISTCFVAGTKVLTKNGLKNIEDIKIGDYVYTINIESNEKELNRVIDTMISKNNKLYKITLKNNKVITSTEKHQYYVLDKGWIRAYELKVGDVLSASIGGKTSIKNIEVLNLDNSVNVYNLTIANNHNYLITENEILVHNAASADNSLHVINDSAYGHYISDDFSEYEELPEIVFNKIKQFNDGKIKLVDLLSASGTKQTTSETEFLKELIEESNAITSVFNISNYGIDCYDKDEKNVHNIDISVPRLTDDANDIRILSFNLKTQKWEETPIYQIDKENKTISIKTSYSLISVMIASQY